MKRSSSPLGDRDPTKRQKISPDKDVPTFFRVRPFHHFNLKFPIFKFPKEIGCFSLDSKRRFYSDNRQAKFMCIPNHSSQVNYNLETGYRDYPAKSVDSNERLESILRWLWSNRHKVGIVKNTDIPNQSEIKKDNFSLHTDFVFWRGLLTNILCVPYERNDELIFCVTLYHGTYYMCEFATEQKRKQEAERSSAEKMMCYGGYKFETYVTSNSPGGAPRKDDPVDGASYCCVVRSRINEHSLLYAAEVDCIDPDVKEDCLRKYVELKTSREILNERHERSFKRYKLLKWWCQSFLVGIPVILCGFRNDNNIVTHLKKYELERIPKLVPKDMWNPTICVNFVDQLLSFIKKVVVKDNVNVVYKFEYIPANDAIYWNEEETNTEFKVLSEWYSEAMKQN